MGYLTSKEIRHKLKIALLQHYGVTNNLIKNVRTTDATTY